jgi:nucleobase:cation symporter-1, NCS1 family
MGAYQYFLLLIGSVFVPLFGVFVAHYFVLDRGRLDEKDLFARGGRYWYRGGVNWMAIIPWLSGFVLYQWSVPTGPAWWTAAVETVMHGWLHLPFPLLDSTLGASLPSFIGAFLLALALGSAPRDAHVRNVDAR